MMTDTSFHYMTHTLLFDGLESFLNDLEQQCSGMYDIVSIFVQKHVGDRAVMGIVIRFRITSELEFNEEEIKRRLGF